ncbi:hypothetical protein TTRE_0000679701 [Trichuris trichiura]|uniref:Uncharacterized protein n=1 Tax=Trichuris trichiura TaxID=36087 RepID=A0A077ZIN9_TRITR|nr:hypothetical protein TTRE_0000679701 [Trichuris trichiura]
MTLQEELLDSQSNVELKARLSQGYQQFWLQKEVPESLVTKKRSQLQVVRRGDLLLRVTSIENNIGRLVRPHLGEPSSSR